jgi:hypothetical protein
MNPFVLSIEPTEGKTFQHGYHLGTDERLARKIAEETFTARNGAAINHPSMWTRTVALMRDGRLFDTFDGRWASDMHDRAFAEMAEAEAAEADADWRWRVDWD